MATFTIDADVLNEIDRIAEPHHLALVHDLRERYRDAGPGAYIAALGSAAAFQISETGREVPMSAALLVNVFNAALAIAELGYVLVEDDPEQDHVILYEATPGDVTMNRKVMWITRRIGRVLAGQDDVLASMALSSVVVLHALEHSVDPANTIERFVDLLRQTLTVYAAGYKPSGSKAS
jgi:hypothetical protein